MRRAPLKVRRRLPLVRRQAEHLRALHRPSLAVQIGEQPLSATIAPSDVLPRPRGIERGVEVRSLADPIKIDSANPADPMAQLALVLLALFGQMERTYTLERAAHARAVATSKGRRIGRPTVVDPDKLAYAAHLRDAGHSIGEIVAKTGIARTSLYRHLPPRPPVQHTEAPNTEERATLDRHQPAGPAESTPVEDRACEPAASAVKSGPANLQAPSTTTTGRAPIGPGGRSGRRQVWFVVEADGRNDQAPVVVLSRHTTQRAAKAALVEACSRPPTREPGEVLEVRRETRS